MADQEIAIVIRTKDTTKPGFDSAAAGVRGFKGEVSKADQVLGSFGLSMGKIGGLLAGTFGIGAIVGAVRSFNDLTGQLTDLSAKTGISTTELQKLKFAAEQNGGTIDGVTRAIGQMARHLVEGDKSAVGAMKRLGLSLADVRQMQPGQAFSVIADAIAKIPSPLEQSALAMQLFGRSGSDMLPMMKGNLQQTMQAAEDLGIVLDEQTVAAGDEFGDQMQVLTTVGQAMIAQVLKPLLPAFVAVAEAMTSAGNVVTFLQEGFQTLIEWSLTAFKTMVDGAIKVRELTGSIPLLGKAITMLDGDTVKTAKDMSQWLDDTIKGMQREIPKSEPPVRNLRTAIAATIPDSKEAAKATRELTKAHNEFFESVRRQSVAGIKANTAQTLAGLIDLRDELRANQQEVLLLQPVLTGWSGNVGDLTDNLQDLIAAGALHKRMTDEEIRAMLTADQATVTWQASLSELAGAMTNLAQTTHSAVVGAFASMVNAVDVGTKAIKSLKGGFDDLTGGGGLAKILSGFTGIVSGIGGIVSAAQAAINIGKALFSVFDRNKGRDLVEQFAAEFEGGFDGPGGLHEMLLRGGDAGEALWIKLTQGTGQNNPEQAKRHIQEVRDFLAKLKDAAASVPTDINVDVGLTYHRNIELEESPGDGFASGTPNLDFMNFGGVTRTSLHGDEAVVPRSGVGQFAAQVATALRGAGAGGGGGTVILQIGEREFARVMLPAFAGEVQRLKLV